jgi:hypothetical protein
MARKPPKGECQRCGFIYSLAALIKEWTGLRVCKKCADPKPAETRAPKVKPEGLPLPNASPETVPTFKPAPTPTPAPPVPVLANLTGIFSLPENANLGDVAGQIQGRTPGSSIKLWANDHGHVNLDTDGITVMRGAIPLTGLAGSTRQFVIREKLAGAKDNPKFSYLNLNVVSESVAPTLLPLALDNNTVNEGTVAGAVVGNILNRTPGSQLEITDTVGGRFALNAAGTQLLTGDTLTDFEDQASHAPVLLETLPGAFGSPLPSTLNVVVVNLNDTQPNQFTLADVIDVHVATIATSNTITVGGLGPQDTATALVSGDPSSQMQKNGGTWASAPATVANGDTLTVRHVSASANLASVSTTLTIGTVSENFISKTEAAPVAGPTFIMAIIAGQSNAEGRAIAVNGVDRTSIDVDVPNAFQFVGWSGHPQYKTWQSDITPLIHYTNYTMANSVLGPGEYILRQLIADNPTAIVGAVPVAQGSTSLVSPAPASWASSPTVGGGGNLFENMCIMAQAAYDKAQVQWPGLTVIPRVFWVQGENDAGHSVTRAAYYSAQVQFIADLRTRLPWLASAPFVIGSVIPQLWTIGDPHYNAFYGGINAAQVDASLNLSNVYYSKGSDGVGSSTDGLHYLPASMVRAQGLRMAATLSDVTGPTITGVTSFTSQNGAQLVFKLTCNDSHATFHINGGADSALFEISDPYLTPTLRWVGNGGGPGVGPYSVGVRARDGRGNYGPTQTITITVSTEVSPTTFFTSAERGMVWDLTDLSLANIAQNIDGTGVVTVGSSVGFLRDLSPNANHWKAAANNTTRPLYQVDSDGSPYLQFDGTNDVLFADTPFIQASDPRYTSSVGLFGAAPTATKVILGSYSSTGGFGFIQGIGTGTTGGNLTTGQRNDAGGGPGPQPVLTAMLDGTTKRIITVSYNGSNSTIRMRERATRDTSGYSSITQGTLGTPITTSRSSLGATSGATPAAFYGGRVYSGYIINRFLSEAEVRSAEDWAFARAFPVLRSLGLTSRTVAEGAAQGTVIGQFTGTTAGSVVTLSDDHGGQFDVSGASNTWFLITGPTPTDYEGDPNPTFTALETRGGSANSPNPTTLTVNVTDVAEASGLSAARLGYPTAANPPTIPAYLPADWQTGDQIRLDRSQDVTFTSGVTTITHSITDAEIAAGQALIGLPTLAGAPWFFRAYAVHAGQAGQMSNKVAWGDSTPPLITVPATITVDSTRKLSVPLTANEPVDWDFAGGLDELQFQIGSTLQWYQDTAKLYTSPNDAGADNVYNVKLRATDYAGNVATKDIAVTINPIDETPDPFTFTPKAFVAVSSLQTSNTVPVTGMAVGYDIPSSLDAGEYSADNGATWNPAGSFTMRTGQNLTLRQTSSAQSATQTGINVTVGSYSTKFNVTTGGPVHLATDQGFDRSRRINLTNANLSYIMSANIGLFCGVKFSAPPSSTKVGWECQIDGFNNGSGAFITGITGTELDFDNSVGYLAQTAEPGSTGVPGLRVGIAKAGTAIGVRKGGVVTNYSLGGPVAAIGDRVIYRMDMSDPANISVAVYYYTQAGGGVVAADSVIGPLTTQVLTGAQIPADIRPYCGGTVGTGVASTSDSGTITGGAGKLALAPGYGAY